MDNQWLKTKALNLNWQEPSYNIDRAFHLLPTFICDYARLFPATVGATVAPLQCHSTHCTFPSKLSVINNVLPSRPPKQQFVRFTPCVPDTILAFGVPSALTTKTDPKLGWHTNKLPSSSIAKPSGPAVPKLWKKRPALLVVPSAWSGSRQTAFARVIATKRNFSSGESTRPFGLTPFSTSVSSLPSGERRYTLPVGSVNPVWPWSVKYSSPFELKMRSFGPLNRSRFRRESRGAILPVDGSNVKIPWRGSAYV